MRHYILRCHQRISKQTYEDLDRIYRLWDYGMLLGHWWDQTALRGILSVPVSFDLYYVNLEDCTLQFSTSNICHLSTTSFANEPMMLMMDLNNVPPERTFYPLCKDYELYSNQEPIIQSIFPMPRKTWTHHCTSSTWWTSVVFFMVVSTRISSVAWRNFMN